MQQKNRSRVEYSCCQPGMACVNSYRDFDLDLPLPTLLLNPLSRLSPRWPRSLLMKKCLMSLWHRLCGKKTKAASYHQMLVALRLMIWHCYNPFDGMFSVASTGNKGLKLKWNLPSAITTSTTTVPKATTSTTT